MGGQAENAGGSGGGNRTRDDPWRSTVTNVSGFLAGFGLAAVVVNTTDLRVSSGVTRRDDQREACDGRREQEPGGGGQAGAPGLALLGRSEQPLDAGDGGGPAGGERGRTGTGPGQEDQRPRPGGPAVAAGRGVRGGPPGGPPKARAPP